MMLRIARIIALASLSLSVIQPMGVAGTGTNANTSESVISVRHSVVGSGPINPHRGARVHRATSCPSGKYPNNGKCVDCQPGYYCTGQTASPTACPVGTYNDQQSGSGSHVCKQVQCGHQPTGGLADNSGATGQKACALGHYSTAGSASCTICPAGNHCGQCPDISFVQSPEVAPPLGSFGSGQNNAGTYHALYPRVSARALTAAMTLDRRAAVCPLGMAKCEVKYGRGGFECVDIKSSLDTCGGCDNDCSTLSGTNEVLCVEGRCVINSCAPGYALAMRGDGVSRGGLDVGKQCVAVRKRSVPVQHSSSVF